MRDVGPGTQQRRAERRRERQQLEREHTKSKEDDRKVAALVRDNARIQNLAGFEQPRESAAHDHVPEGGPVKRDPPAARHENREQNVDSDSKPPAVVQVHSRSPLDEPVQPVQNQLTFQLSPSAMPAPSAIPALAQQQIFNASTYRPGDQNPSVTSISQSAREQLLQQLLTAALQSQHFQRQQLPPGLPNLSHLFQSSQSTISQQVPTFFAPPAQQAPAPQQGQISTEQLATLLRLLLAIRGLSDGDRNLLAQLLNAHFRR